MLPLLPEQEKGALLTLASVRTAARKLKYSGQAGSLREAVLGWWAL